MEVDYSHETIIGTGITCNEISCYMRDSASWGLLLKMLKYFEIMLKIFEFSHVKETVKF